MMQPLSKIVWLILTKQNTDLTQNPVIATLDFNPNDLKMCVHTKTPATLLITTKNWKQPRCPLIECDVSILGSSQKEQAINSHKNMNESEMQIAK